MSTTTAADVLNDIEFELLQGSVERNELGQGIQATRQFQNEIRATTLQSAASDKLEVSDLVGRQFQINDMMLSLFQATDMRLSGLQSELHRAAYLKLHEPQNEVDVGAQSAALNAYDVDDLSLQSQNWTPGYVDDGADDDLAEVIDEDVLTVSMHVRPVRIPLVGWFLSRVRNALHTLTLYYVNQLGQEQTGVNRTFAEHIRHLEAVNRLQQNQIEALNRQVTALRAKIDS